MPAFDARRIVFTSQRLFNGLKPIMAAGCSLFTDPERPYGKVHIVLMTGTSSGCRW